jgi:hypothetical protein
MLRSQVQRRVAFVGKVRIVKIFWVMLQQSADQRNVVQLDCLAYGKVNLGHV